MLVGSPATSSSGNGPLTQNRMPLPRAASWPGGMPRGSFGAPGVLPSGFTRATIAKSSVTTPWPGSDA